MTTFCYMLIIRHIIKLFWNNLKYLNLLWNKFHVNLLTHLRNHICLQFCFAHSPLPAFAKVPFIISLSLRTQYIRSGVMLCCKAKLGFSYSICDDRGLCKKYMQISTLLPYIRSSAVYMVWKFTAQFVFVLKFRNLTYTVFRDYDVIALRLNPVEAAVSRHLVGNCRSLRWSSFGREGGFEPVTVGHDAA